MTRSEGLCLGKNFHVSGKFDGIVDKIGNDTAQGVRSMLAGGVGLAADTVEAGTSVI